MWFVMLQKKRTFWFILLTLVAALFHVSAIVFLLAWPIYRYSKPVITLAICAALTVADLATGHALINRLSFLFVGDRFDTYLGADQMTDFSGGGTFYLYVLFFAFIIFARLAAKKRLEDIASFDKIFNVACVTMMLIVMCQNLPVFFRIGYYFMLPFNRVSLMERILSE